ncbi:pimeloyl-ACP methyl ester carboxylesterase [Granulicella aggregans]|uniref:Pimeloyl-ACP methyl ester carboxylesterase n=1 Tax=Granulicella aggregans TaxID=474949 RepID=A0A7W8E5M1_9BACT|nr:alpha/beta hydrolase [Granulicella aggregans]MBB5060273.1 pimeloyl-ACP methyl ester carboxylesterase [Granulicella aggregans]
MRILFATALGLLLASTSLAQQTTTSAGTGIWHDPSPHTVQFVTVDKDVQLEVLDWGGTGRPVVLLAGLSDTAHVFDDFALKLTPSFHVYGITRRGFGASSAPAVGYSADRLADDILAVLDALKINHPVLIGHSMAGEELSSVATRFPKRIAGLVYLDAAHEYAYLNPERGDYQVDLNALLGTLQQLQIHSGDVHAIDDLLQVELPRFQRDLRVQEDDLALASKITQSLGPTPADLASFDAFHQFSKKFDGIDIPESELRQQHLLRPDGGVGRMKAGPAVFQGIISGEERFSKLQVPILAFFTIPRTHGTQLDRLPPSLGTALVNRETMQNQEQADAFQAGVPSAKVVIIPNANHGVFLSNENEVLREIANFIGGLPSDSELPER